MMSTQRKTHSLRAAINAFCRQCIVDAKPGNGTAAAQIHGCTAHACPLWPVRPYRNRVVAVPGALYGDAEGEAMGSLEGEAGAALSATERPSRAAD